MKVSYSFSSQRANPPFSLSILQSIQRFVLLLFFIGSSTFVSAQVIISEVFADGTFELSNTSNNTVDISNYWICNFPAYRRLGTLTVECGSLNLTAGAKVVLSSAGLYPTGSTGHRRSGLAQGNGIWDGNAATAFTTAQSLVRGGTGFTAASWTINAAPMICRTQVVISEVLSNSTFELHNLGDTTVDLSSYWICNFPIYRQLSTLTLESGSLQLAAGAKVVLSSAGLYPTNSAAALISYLEWGSTGHRRSGLAQSNGIWDGMAVPSFISPQSLIRTGTGFTAASWIIQTSTPPYDESINGDLSDDATQPTALTLSVGNNTIGACVQGTPLDVDYFTFEVPVDYVLSAIELTDYTGAGPAFLGIQAGNTFTEPRTGTMVENLLGGIIYGTGNVGTDILPAIGILTDAMGFTGALPAGQYTIWLNETSSNLSCPTFNLVLSAAVNDCPETLTFDNQVISSDTFNASNSITTMNDVSLANGATVVFEAGQSVTLNPGFTAIPTNGGSFTARIFDCTTATIVEAPTAEARNRNTPTTTIIAPNEVLSARVYPNPASSEITLAYTLPESQEVIINIFNSNGMLIHQLLPKQIKDAGKHSLHFYTNELQTGMYFIGIQTKTKQIYRKVSIIVQ